MINQSWYLSGTQDSLLKHYFFVKERIMGMMKEFAVKGNVIDMAVDIIIGAAFGEIVSSFVGDVIMPPIGVLLGCIDFFS